MKRIPLPCTIFVLLLMLCRAEAEDGFSVKCPSPDGRFALRLTDPKGPDGVSYKVDLIDKTSGEVILDLENASENYLDDTVLVWSSDSRRVAFGTRGYKEGDTAVFFWNGSVFEEVRLPGDLPLPKINFGKGAGAVKNYGGAVKPVRWSKSGELELSSDLMMLSRVNEKAYTGVVLFTVGFDPHHRATVRKIGKTKTSVDG